LGLGLIRGTANFGGVRPSRLVAVSLDRCVRSGLNSVLRLLDCVRILDAVGR